MYSQKHVTPYFYAALSAVFSKTTASLFSSPTDSWNVGLKCHNPVTNNLDVIPKADIDGSGCAITLDCLLDERHEATANNGSTPALNVTLTLPSSGEDVADVRRCREGLERLLFGGQEDSRSVGVWANQRHLEQDRSHGKEPGLLSSRQSEEDLDAGLEEQQKYRGIVDYLMSSIQRRTIQKAANFVHEGKRNLQGKLTLASIRDDSARFPRNLNPMFFKKRSFSYYLARCEDSFCEGYHLEKTCGPNTRVQHKLKPTNICEVCYPKRNDLFIRHHCERRIEREMRAFYGVCILLSVTIVVAIFLYLFRRMGRKLKIRYRLLWNMRRNQFSKNPGAKGTFSSSSVPAVVPRLFSNTHMDRMSGREDGATDNADGSMSFTMFQRKFNQIGAVSRGYRRRIQDVFDIESLEPKRVEEEKIFVLPRAPNASIRTSATGNPNHPQDDIEMESVESGTVRRMFVV